MICLRYTVLLPGESQHAAGIRLRDGMLLDFCGIASPSVAVDEGGKPRLTDHPDIHFSLSHSGSVAVCALSFPGKAEVENAWVICDAPDAPAVGADVEQIDDSADIPRLRRLTERFFPPQEVERLRGVPDSLYPAAFSGTWTALESFVKRTGEGFRHGFSHIDLSSVHRITDTLEMDGETYVITVVY